MDMILQGLKLTGISIATVFAVLAILYFLIILLQKLFGKKDEKNG